MDRMTRGTVTRLYPLGEHEERFWPPSPGDRGPLGEADDNARRHRQDLAVAALITGLISLGLWPLGPIAAWLGIVTCSRRHGLHGSHLWMALTGTVAGLLATFGLVVFLVAKATLHLV